MQPSLTQQDATPKKEKDAFDTISDRIKDIKTDGSFYYMFRALLSAITYFFTILEYTEPYQLITLPFAAAAASFRTIKNIQEYRVAPATNLNLWQKVLLNTLMTAAAILGFVALFVFSFSFLAPALAVFYGLKFIFKTGQAGLYLYRYFMSEPGSDRRDECWGRFKRYSFSAVVCLLSTAALALITIAHVFTGGITTGCLLGLSMFVGALNTGYVAYADLGDDNNIVETLNDLKLINAQEPKKQILNKLITQKIKGLEKQIEFLDNLKTKTSSNPISQVWNKIKYGFFWSLYSSTLVKREKIDYLKSLQGSLNNNMTAVKPPSFKLLSGETALLGNAIKELNQNKKTQSPRAATLNENFIITIKKIDNPIDRREVLVVLINNNIATLKENIKNASSKSKQAKQSDELIFLEKLREYLAALPTSPAELSLSKQKNATTHSPKHFLETTCEKKIPYTPNKYNPEKAEILFKAVVMHQHLIEVADGATGVHKPGKKGKFFYQDLTDSMKSIKDPKKRKEFLINLLDLKIKDLAKSNKISPKAQNKLVALTWFKEWIDNDRAPKEFYTSLPEDAFTGNNSASPMKKTLEYTALKTEKQVEIASIDDWNAAINECKKSNRHFKDDVFSSYWDGIGETYGLIRTVHAYVNMKDSLVYDKIENAPSTLYTGKNIDSFVTVGTDKRSLSDHTDNDRDSLGSNDSCENFFEQRQSAFITV